MINKPSHEVATIADVRTIKSNGPWQTKSKGQLNVLFGINYDTLQNKYFHYEESEMKKIPHDIRGLRSYSVDGLQKGSIGANEWHRLRNELVFVIKGKVKWTCEDINGNKSIHILDQTSGIWVPPFILHTYESMEDDSELLVVANTLFIPDEPATHDTFTSSDYHLLQIK